MATELTDARWRQADLMGRISLLRANAAGNRRAADTCDATADALVAELMDINAALEAGIA
jgi:hypothetical protein